MALNYAYNYAEIDPATNMCIGVHSMSEEAVVGPYWVEIPVNDQEYLFKYYIDGAWYEDSQGLIPWASSLL
jgi:hypothetical protein